MSHTIKIWGAFHSTKISGNFGPKLKGSVRSNPTLKRWTTFPGRSGRNFVLNGSCPFDFKLTFYAKIQPVQLLLTLITPRSRVGHALRPVFMLWLVKIWQVSSCGKCMQHLESCLLIAEADRVLCHLEMFLTVFFPWMYTMKYSCYQDSSVIHGWFVYWVSGWEIRRLSKWSEIWYDFGWHRFRFSPCLMRKKVEKS